MNVSEHTITSRCTLRAQLKAIALQGYAVNREFDVPDVRRPATGDGLDVPARPVAPATAGLRRSTASCSPNLRPRR